MPIRTFSPPEPPDERRLFKLLAQASQLEHLLAAEYLFAAFSLKKFPEEFEGAAPLEADAQVERNRRWAATILFVARQEMEHLALVQNLLAILDAPPSLWRPNFPVPKEGYPLRLHFVLRRFEPLTLEAFRYYEKPDSLDLRPPQLPEHEKGESDFVSGYGSLQQLYGEVRGLFDGLLKSRRIHGRSPDRVVSEGFGFNLTLPTLVVGQYDQYVDAVAGQILEEGEGIGEETPALGSHFMAFQGILAELGSTPAGDPALPVVSNPSLEARKGATLVTNPTARRAMRLFDDAYVLMVRMLSGYFADYSIDTTTGLRPHRVNACFQTAFFPFMTMVVRPLGEILCRLPADEGDVPRPGRLPKRTAGPSFDIRSPQGKRHGAEKRAAVAAFESLPDYLEAFDDLLRQLETLVAELPPDYAPAAGQGFKEGLTTIHENLGRMKSNFGRYWRGEMEAPIPSRGFTNFATPFN